MFREFYSIENERERKKINLYDGKYSNERHNWNNVVCKFRHEKKMENGNIEESFFSFVYTDQTLQYKKHITGRKKLIKSFFSV